MKAMTQEMLTIQSKELTQKLQSYVPALAEAFPGWDFNVPTASYHDDGRYKTALPAIHAVRNGVLAKLKLYCSQYEDDDGWVYLGWEARVHVSPDWTRTFEHPEDAMQALLDWFDRVGPIWEKIRE